MNSLESVQSRYRQITLRLIELRRTITCMESCTCGLISSLITDTEGASSVFPGGFITYCNEHKIRAGVPAEVIEKYGVYSRETACAMASACRNANQTCYGVGITGSFGTVDPNNPDSVPGEAHFAIASPESVSGHTIVLPAGLTRFESKLSAASAIADQLLKQLGIGTD